MACYNILKRRKTAELLTLPEALQRTKIIAMLYQLTPISRKQKKYILILTFTTVYLGYFVPCHSFISFNHHGKEHFFVFA